MKCSQARILILDHQNEALPPSRRQDLVDHCSQCAECATFSSALDALSETLQADAASLRPASMIDLAPEFAAALDEEAHRIALRPITRLHAVLDRRPLRLAAGALAASAALLLLWASPPQSETRLTAMSVASAERPTTFTAAHRSDHSVVAHLGRTRSKPLPSSKGGQ